MTTRPRLERSDLELLYRRGNLRGVLYTVTVFAGIGGAWAAAALTPLAWLPAFVLVAALQHHLLILHHEAPHHLLLTKRSANDRLGRIVGYPIGFAMAYRR